MIGFHALLSVLVCSILGSAAADNLTIVPFNDVNFQGFTSCGNCKKFDPIPYTEECKWKRCYVPIVILENISQDLMQEPFLESNCKKFDPIPYTEECKWKRCYVPIVILENISQDLMQEPFLERKRKKGASFLTGSLSIDSSSPIEYECTFRNEHEVRGLNDMQRLDFILLELERIIIAMEAWLYENGANIMIIDVCLLQYADETRGWNDMQSFHNNFLEANRFVKMFRIVLKDNQKELDMERYDRLPLENIFQKTVQTIDFCQRDALFHLVLCIFFMDFTVLFLLFNGDPKQFPSSYLIITFEIGTINWWLTYSKKQPDVFALVVLLLISMVVGVILVSICCVKQLIHIYRGPTSSGSPVDQDIRHETRNCNDRGCDISDIFLSSEANSTLAEITKRRTSESSCRVSVVQGICETTLTNIEWKSSKPLSAQVTHDEEGKMQTAFELADEIERTLCKVCFDTEMSVVFLPCHHLVTCESCADKFQCCVVCRALIEGSFTINFN